MTHRTTAMGPRYTTADFDYALPDGLIARYPVEVRDQSRLLHVDRGTGDLRHHTFRDLPQFVASGDVLVVNDSRVRAARLVGQKPTGAAAEILLLRPAPADRTDREVWEALVRPGTKLKPGRRVDIADDLVVHILDSTPDGGRIVALESPGDVARARERHAMMPLPPYIERAAEESDRERYQTVYAKAEGSVAAPTAGLHFTEALLDELRTRGVTIASVRLDVGVGTFRPVEAEDPSDHDMHREWFDLPEPTVRAILEAQRHGGSVWAVGTTVVRVLETAARAGDGLQPGSAWTDLFIRPGFDFRVVDRLITNFHLPQSTLLMLVSAFAGYDQTMAAYAATVEERYRFYSYGDAVVIT